MPDNSPVKPPARRTAVVRACALVLLLATSCAHADTATAVRQFIEGLDAGDAPLIAGETLNEPSLLAGVYRARDHAPFWVERGPLAGEAASLLAAIGESVAHGFDPDHYHRDAIERLRDNRGGDARLAYELLLTDAFLSQALHRARGIIHPPNLDAEWQLPTADIDAAQLLDTTAAHGNVTGVLSGLWPVAPEYRLLLQRRAEIIASGDSTTVQIAPGGLLRPGQSSDRVVLLKERLQGPGVHTPVYDDELKREVIAFQHAAGLEPDGLVGDSTIEALNETRDSWIDRIDANLERWRWLPRETPSTYLRVNIANYALRAYVADRPVLAMDVIVGQPYRRTPVFSEMLKYLVINPYWNVPYSIATKDKLKLLKADAEAEAAKGYEARPQGSDQFVSVAAIDWSGVTAKTFNMLLRQKPGPQNALGRIKFMLPNPYAVYLHDTPSRELFRKTERSFSSGCVRLSEPMALAQWLLERDGHPQAGELRRLVESGDTHTLYLRTPVPTYIVYFTVFADDDGDVVFRRDVYQRDAVLVEALKGNRS